MQFSVMNKSSCSSSLELECPGAPRIVQHPRFEDHYFAQRDTNTVHELKRVRTIIKSAGLRKLALRKLNAAKRHLPDINGIQMVADSRWPKPNTLHESLFFVSKCHGTTPTAANPIDRLHHTFTPPASR
ncbi:hypothetical protein M378DRAFT_160980 [Amanita muscaria Koide BX008]|uniref:Uncharacterized protein n=1 Tax=Amanita muscaria (strain Koide BX008) TaxID=946122 RepID=A0A0C2XB26_AMAMK|nr:hypothetical protein M378DRAFT_160980 [Amanita muscaria Koide BX008]